MTRTRTANRLFALSYSFYVAGPAPRNSSLLLDGVRCREEEHLESHAVMKEGFFYHFHVPRRSTRGVEVGYERGSFQVRFLSLSSPEDYDLGFSLLERVAPRMDGLVQPEDGDRLAVTVLRKSYDNTWVDQMLRSHVDIVHSGHIGGPNEILTMPAIVRPVHFGPRMRAELGKGPPQTLIDRVLDRVRLIQYIDEDDECYVANVMEAAPPNAPPFTTTAWAPGLPYLFPQVDYLSLLRGEGEGIVQVPYSAVLELAGPRARYLDEAQIHVDAIDGAEWKALIAHAEKLAVDTAAGPRKKWWQFWK